MSMRRVLAAAVVFAFGAVGLAGLMAAGETITVKGSDTMVILGQRWAEE